MAKKLRKVKVVLKKIFLFLGMMCVASYAKASGMEQKMDVRIGVFDAATVVFKYNETNKRYDISALVQTENLFNALYPFKAEYLGKGRVNGGVVVPELYQTKSRSRNHIRTKKIFYDAQGVAYKRISTKDKKESSQLIENVPPSANAADLQTIFAELIWQFKQKKSCQLMREVYDGKKHFRVVVKDDGSETRYFDFSKRKEKAYKCSLYIENLKDNNDNVLWEVSADKPIFLWIGQDKKTEMPYVLEIKIDSTPLGALKVIPESLDID